MRYAHCNCPQANIYTLFNNASKKQTSKNPISFAYEHTALFVIVYSASTYFL